MYGRSDAIVTAFVLLSLASAVMSIVCALVAGVGYAVLAALAACYLVLLAMFVISYIGGGDG